MLNSAPKGHNLRSSRQLLKVKLLLLLLLKITWLTVLQVNWTSCWLSVKEHQQLEQEAKDLAQKINSIVGRAQHLASNHFNSQKILQETDTYLSL